MIRWDINRKRRDAREVSQHVIQHYLYEHPCVDCGESDQVVLEFDHREPETKRAAVSTLIRRGASVERLIEEINLCDVRCCNCHRRRTAYQGDSWRIRERLQYEHEYSDSDDD